MTMSSPPPISAPDPESRGRPVPVADIAPGGGGSVQGPLHRPRRVGVGARTGCVAPEDIALLGHHHSHHDVDQKGDAAGEEDEEYPDDADQ